MSGVDPKAFEYALSLIEDGFIFESFVQSFLSKIIGYEFSPVGGIKDRGIDGLEHLYQRKGFERVLYQISIQKTCENKLESTLKTLCENNIQFDQLCFVTNRVFEKQDILIDSLVAQYKKHIRIFDLKWFSANVNNSQATINDYHTFISSNLHEFNKPGKSYEISNLVGDPRLFVFLSQQWEGNKRNSNLSTILSDTLILYALEGTDPDKNLFKTKDDILKDIAKHIKFEPRLLYDKIDKRLQVLSGNLKRIRYHSKIQSFCLPYETRLEIQQKNLKDNALHEEFKRSVENKLKQYLRDAAIRVSDTLSLIESSIHRLFYQQGLEFADFILKGENQQSFEKNLPDIISKVVDESPVVAGNKEEVKSSLLMTIRDVVYNGTIEQKSFLQRLSNTYMMLFLLRCEPQLCTFFETMAAKLNIYVCTSIIIPALSEFYLESSNRRHWNLLKGAHDAGVTLIINETILDELSSHFNLLINKYEQEYKDNEDFYLGDEDQMIFIEEIMIRSYFYAKMRNKVDNFYAFINNFVTPTLGNARSELVDYLKEEFGINFKSNSSIGVKIIPEERSELFNILKKKKSAPVKAETDTELILTIYGLREKNNELGTAGIFGYKTWWLSKDTSTQQAVNEAFGNKYKVSCYIRPDFLYNYISLAPKKMEIDAAYHELFPSLLGVNISYHLPSETINFIHQHINQHKSQNPARLKATLHNLAEEIKVNPRFSSKDNIKHYLDDKLSK